MQKQNRAGRIALKIATLLLCAVFATTSVLSTTFAKYTTTGEVASDSARVAKWGIELSNGSNDYTSWSVEENETSITAASSGTTGDKIIAPGTSGYLACFRVEGNPEVAHNVSMNYEVTIPGGYKKLIGQKDYFPILITVGRATYDASNNVTARKEIHYYVSSAGSLDTLIGQVDSGTFSENIVPNGWSGSGYAEYYVRWDWFYNADDVPSYIPENVKDALVAYQSTGNDTLLADAMVQRLDASKFFNTKYSTFKTAIDSARANYTTGTDASCTTGINNLTSALNTFLAGTPYANSYEAYPSSGTNGTYTYTEEAQYVWWHYLYQGGVMQDKDEYLKNFTVTTSHLNTIISSEGKGDMADSSYFLCSEQMIPINDDTYYEYTFEARNLRTRGYSGVVIGYIPVTVGNNTLMQNLFLYGGFTNYSDPYYETVSEPGCVLHLCRGDYNTKIKTYDYPILLPEKTAENPKFYHYKVVYNGLNLTVYYKDNLTNNTYTALPVNGASYTYTMPEGSYIKLGVMSREGYSDSLRTTAIRSAQLHTKHTTSPKTVLRDLIDKADSVYAIYAPENNGFTISANADITITQIKSSIDVSKYDALTAQITSATSIYNDGKGSDADCTAAITALEADLAAYLGIPARTFGYTTNETETINWNVLINGGFMRAEEDLNNYSDNYRIESKAGENTSLKLIVNTTNSDNVEMFYLMDHNMDNTTYPITEDTYYVYDFHARNRPANRKYGYGGVVFAHDGTNTYTLYGSFLNKSTKGDVFHLGVYKGDCVNGTPSSLIGEKTGTVEYNKCGTQSTNYGIYRIIYDGLKVTVQYKSSATAYSNLGEFELPERSYITLGAMVNLKYISSSEHSMVVRTCKLTKPPTLSPQTALWDLINEATAVINPSDD